MGLISTNLSRSIQRGCVLVGVGSVLRGDDAFGPEVIKQLRARTSLPLFDAGTAPENWFGPILSLNRAEVIIIDAVCTDGVPGSLEWIDPEDLQSQAVGTHAASLDIFVKFVKQSIGADVHILGVIPVQLQLAHRMSDEVIQAVRSLVSTIIELAPAPSPCSHSQ